ncbi:hypothetical protein C8J57DRAFT_1240645 [Mycena rebaudengoi]|nr:hypothetical protein C8J57DRAFT_1240645 [Mycena rebaudengoi]
MGLHQFAFMVGAIGDWKDFEFMQERLHGLHLRCQARQEFAKVMRSTPQQRKLPISRHQHEMCAEHEVVRAKYPEPRGSDVGRRNVGVSEGKRVGKCRETQTGVQSMVTPCLGMWCRGRRVPGTKRELELVVAEIVKQRDTMGEGKRWRRRKSRHRRGGLKTECRLGSWLKKDIVKGKEGGRQGVGTAVYVWEGSKDGFNVAVKIQKDLQRLAVDTADQSQEADSNTYRGRRDNSGQKQIGKASGTQRGVGKEWRMSLEDFYLNVKGGSNGGMGHVWDIRLSGYYGYGNGVFSMMEKYQGKARSEQVRSK